MPDDRTREQKLLDIAKIICPILWHTASSNDKRNAMITATAVLANVEFENELASRTVLSEVRVPSDDPPDTRRSPVGSRRAQRPDTQQARRRRSWRPR